MAEHNRFNPFEISSLIVRQISAEISSAEQAKLDEWLLADPKNAATFESLQDKQLWRREISGMKAFDSQLALQKVLDKINHKPEPKRRKLWPAKYIAAAVVLICLAFASYFLKTKPQHTGKGEIAAIDTSPAEKITLTLSDGKKIDLSASAQDTLINQGSASIKNQQGILSYESQAGKTMDNTEQRYNTLHIPPGYQYQVVLPDGSAVWLNAGSTLKFPVVFNTKERLVELSGEAYFEVKHQQNKPFSVKSATQTVEVLGTHFNIQAYPEDASTITTLAEGSVQINNGRTSAKLKPGQMVVNTSSSSLIPKEANLTEALAWTNGKFSFSDDRLEDIMKKVARRYQVEVVFQDDVKDKRFWGSYPIDKGLKNLLKNLEQTNTVRFRLDGRRVIVTQ